MKLSKVLGVVSLVVVPLLLLVGVASAQTFRSGDNVAVHRDETIDSSLYSAARNIDIAGTVNGDVICAGMSISVSGTVNGDVICAGQNVNITGTINGDVRVAGQSITLDGEVSDNASFVGTSISTSSQSSVGRDLSAAGSDAVLNGNVGRDASLAVDNTIINSRIDRNINSNADKLALREGAAVGGGLYYTSGNEAEISDQARVAGETIRSEPKQTKGTFETPLVTGFEFVVYIIAALLLLSVALVLLFPRWVHEVSNMGILQPWRALLVGLLVGLVFPVVFIILMISVLGIPLSLLLLLAWLLILFLAGPIFSYYLGRQLLREQTNPIFIMALGALVVLLLLFIPILGFLVWLVAMWMGSGMLLLDLFKRTPKPEYTVKPL